MGGALALLTSVFVPESDAVVVWYGFPPLEYIDATKIRAPLMGHFATQDQFFPIAQVDKLEEKLKESGVTYTFHRYEAQHAFGNETMTNPPIPVRYDERAAATAWERTVAFFNQHLGAAQRA
jgi:carboxymethylenebutenolidase